MKMCTEVEISVANEHPARQHGICDETIIEKHYERMDRLVAKTMDKCKWVK